MKIQGVSNRVKIYRNNNIPFKSTIAATQNNSLSSDKEISKELSQASKSNFIVKNNFPNALSFGKKMTLDEILKIDGETFEGCSGDDLKKFVNNKENKGKWIPLVGRRPFSPESISQLRNNGYYGPIYGDHLTGYISVVYMDNDGSTYYYNNGKCMVDNLEHTLVEGLLSDGKVDDALNFHNFFHSNEYHSSYIDNGNGDELFERLLSLGREDDALSVARCERRLPYLVSHGREDEAIERGWWEGSIDKEAERYKFSTLQNIDTIEKPATNSSYFAKGDFRGAVLNRESIPHSAFRSSNLSEHQLLEIANYIKDAKTLEDKEQTYKKECVSKAQGVLDDNPDLRFILRLGTLGISEALNKLSLQYDILKKSKHSNWDARVTYEEISSVLFEMLNAREKEFADTKAKIKLNATKALDVQTLIEPMKGLLNKRLIKPIYEFNNNQNIEVMNCLMLTGNNPYIAENLVDWIDNNYNDVINFVRLSSKRDSAQMQEDLLNALETAEENYQETNRRSVIFVNGMEKLLRPDFNDSAEIAVMKDLMSCASEDYHSTIIFYAKEPEKLEPGTVVSHRIGLKIEIPDIKL